MLLTDYLGRKESIVCVCWIVIPLCADGHGDHFACNCQTKIKLVQERDSDE